MSPNIPRSEKGRGAQIAPPNRFDAFHAVPDLEHFVDDEDESERSLRTTFVPDQSRSIVSENDSPDLNFRFSLNPYRGCEHGCAYCYARPTHEYLGFNAGLDFESKILVKQRAPELFRDWLSRRTDEPTTVVFSGVTDCYQPAERTFKLTRGCLQVALEARQPIGIVTKNALIVRDIDVLAAMAELKVVSVAVSVTTLDAELARTLEPRTSPPASRLDTIAKLTAAGIPTLVMVAPIIPGLNDTEIPEILRAAKSAGANSASYTLLRLPLTVRPVFQDWLKRTQPLKAARVESLIRSTRDGELNNSNFGRRMRGTGQIAEQIQRTFQVFARKHRLDQRLPSLDTSQFRPPTGSSGQLRLF